MYSSSERFATAKAYHAFEPRAAEISILPSGFVSGVSSKRFAHTSHGRNATSRSPMREIEIIACVKFLNIASSAPYAPASAP